jgi:hypothetical protein
MSKTTSGFEYKIDERIKTDWDFLETTRTLQDNPTDITLMKKLFIMLIGEEGFERLKKHIKNGNDGYCPVDVLSQEFTEMIQSNSQIKK